MFVVLVGGLSGIFPDLGGCCWQQFPGNMAKLLNVFSDSYVNSQHSM